MSEKINPFIRTAKQAKTIALNGVLWVKDGVYRVGQSISAGIFYAGQSSKEEHDKLMKKLKEKKK